MSGKRANIFGQGKPERPYEEREDDPAEVPQRATAAQLATRKIKTAKMRRPAGGAATPSQSANFGAPQQSGFGFGSSAPAVGGNNNVNGMFGATNNAFGGGATNSFPPAQSAAPSNTFTSSSFPAFGATSQSTGFNPQPPSANDFNFTAGSGNPFAAQNGGTNGNSTPPAFGGGSIFSSQAPSNPFAGLTQNSTTTSAGSGGLFGTSNSAPATNMFGTTNSASNASNASTPAATPFTFGAPSSSAQNTASTPATSNLFSGFGTSTQNNPPPAQNSLFSGFGANAQGGGATQQEAPQKSLFTTGTSAQGTGNATATAPATSLFNFGSNAQQTKSTTSTAAPSNMFGGSSTPSSAPASNPFASLPTSAAPTTPSFSFGQQTPQTQEKPQASNPFGAIKLPEESAGTPKPALFGSIKAPEQSANGSAETPKANLFSSLAKPPPAASTPDFSIFGTSQNKDTNSSAASQKPSGTAGSNAPEADRSSLFRGFSTPQPAKTTEVEKPQAGLFSAAQPKTSSGLFSQTFQPENNNSSNAFKAQSTFFASKPQTSSTESSKETSDQSAPAKEPSNPFSKLPAPPAERPNLFAPPKEQASAPSPSSMSSLTGGASSSSGTTSGPELPKIPKAHVPKEWAASNASGTLSTDNLYKLISSLTMQLQQLNDRYRTKLNSLSPSADWSSLSLWHHQHSSAIKKKIDIAKKQRAAANGVTGNESALSTKRKVNDESPEDRDASPSKRARPADAQASPTPQPSIPPPKLNPPATATSNIFAKAINNKPAAPTEPSSLFAPKTAPAPAPSTEPSKSAAPVTGFQPNFSGPSGASASQSPFSASAFKPTTTSTSTTGPPVFKPVTTAVSGGFASQFAASAKTYEQLAAERKKKAMEEDYDSDDETKEEWSTRYDKKEAERIAKEKAAAAAAPAFTLPAFGKTPAASTPASNLFASLPKPASGTSTPGLFGSRPASPALSNSGSVFDAPSTAQTPSSNIFGHLSSGASSNHHEESEEDEGEQGTDKSQNGHQFGSVESTTPPKQKYGATGTEAPESLDEAAKSQKQNTSSKGSLLSRMTRPEDDGSESEKENNSSSSIFGQTNGTQTPTNKPFSFFDFGAAGANTAPPKSDTFAGDQTFKPGTPIKFGNVAATEKKAAPTFQFQPATASTTPSKPPPTSLFNFGSSTSGSSLLAPNSGLSGLNSAPSSTFTSRAATPLSEAETSAASAAEDDEEGGKHEQVDLSKLTSEELAANDVVFETEQALAKHQVDQGDGTKAWENFARGPLYILKDKVTGKCFVRIRIPSGQTPLNYSILPALKTSVTGSSGKMVMATMPKKEGGFTQFFISLKTKEVAKEFSEKYNASLPS